MNFPNWFRITARGFELPVAIFDMDGLLIDSEPLWQDAEIAVFGEMGVALTRSMCRETMGVRIDHIVRHWYERFPWEGSSFDEVERRIVALVGQLMRERGAPMPGVNAAIEEAGVDDDTVSEDLGFANIHYYAAAATKYGTEANGG